MFLRGVGTRMHTMKVLKGHSNVLLLTLKSKKVPEVLGRKSFFSYFWNVHLKSCTYLITFIITLI